MPGPPKTPAEAAAIARRNCVVEVFASLVPVIASRIAREIRSTNDDAEQAGYLGLLDAATKFEAYARKRIEGAIRDSKRQRDYCEDRHVRHEEIGPMPDPVGNLDDFVLLSELWRAIEIELTPGQARVLRLVANAESQQEVAEQLGVSRQAVSKAHAKAVRLLRVRLAA